MIPIVLHHGLFGMGDVQIGPLKVSYFKGIDTAFRKRGHEVLVSKVHPTASIASRAQQLKQQIVDRFPKSKRVLIFAHSMGGLDARYMIHKLDMHGRVAGLVSMTTPHRGSPYADWCSRHLGERLGAFSICRALGIDVDGIPELTTESCARFNDQTPDHPDVRYFSVSAARPWHLVPPWGMLSHRIVADLEGENDGLVSVKSSTWGHHLGVWPADHWHMVNHRFVLELNNPTGDISPFYLRLMARLSAEHFV